MYEIHLSSVDNEALSRCGVTTRNLHFYLADSDSVCELIKNLLNKYIVSLKEFDFDSVSDILSRLSGKYIMWQLQVQVFASPDSRRNDKVLFERIVDLPDGIDIPFSSLLKDLKFMYGQSVIVSFSVL